MADRTQLGIGCDTPRKPKETERKEGKKKKEASKQASAYRGTSGVFSRRRNRPRPSASTVTSPTNTVEVSASTTSKVAALPATDTDDLCEAETRGVVVGVIMITTR